MVEKAGDDLEMAKRAMRGKRKISWLSCYHAQQSAEKYLKAFLISNNQEPERTHNVVKILNECKVIDPLFTFLEGYAEFLTPFAVEIRYPGDVPLKSHHAQRALKAANEIKNFVVERIR